MAVKGAGVHLYGDWDGSGVKRASKDISKFEKQAKGFSSNVTKSFAGLGATVGGALAFGAITSQLRDMAQAAAEDQKSVVALGKAFQNVGLGAAADEAESFVEQLMLATGVADTDLRSSLQTLTTATGDFAQAQRLVRVAMDASAATGRDLSTVTLAIAKASQGNVGALTRLGIPLDANIVKTKDFNAALEVMEDRFGGQAAAAADTYAGKIQRVSMAVGEAQEIIGYELLASLDAVSNALGGTDGAVSGIIGLGEEASASIRPLRELAETLDKVGIGTDILGSGFDALVRTIGGPVTSAWMRWGRDLQEGDERQAAFSEHLGDIRQRFMDLAVDAGILDRNYQVLAEDTEAATDSFDKQRSAVDRLKSSLDKLNGKNRSVMSDRISLRRAKAEGPNATGGKKGNVVTRDDRRVWGLDIAQQAEALATSLADKGKLAQARAVLDANRAFLTEQVGAKFASRVLATPASLDRGDKAQRTAGQRYEGGMGTTNNYYFGDLLVKDAAEAAEQARRAARLKALGSGRVAEAARYSAMAGAR